MDKKIIIGIGIVVLVGIIFFGFKGGITGNVVAGELIDDGDVVKVPKASITKNADWYDYQGIKFFVVKSGSDIKTAFDACDVCGGSKGYRQEGKDMVCNNCGNHYPISGIGTANLRGGCWPSYLPRTIDGDYIVIKKSDLEAGGFRF